MIGHPVSEEKMMKRVVTGHSSEGKPIFLTTGEPPRTFTSARGNQMSYAWQTQSPVIVSANEDDPTLDMPQDFKEMVPVSGATNFLFITFPGNMLGVMHATDTVDYIVIISGEVWLILDDEAEVHLTAGDCVVQNGTLHAWQNRSSEPCTLASIMIGATRKV
jgi:mannose-6-phosphate isomerase-like protein (cupin superfamily)